MRPSSFYRNLAVQAARLADRKKCDDIQLLNLQRHSSLTDYMLLLTVHSTAQMRAVQETLDQEFGKLRIRPLHNEGDGNSQWQVLDYGGLMVHLFKPEARQFYGLERLWNQVRRIRWEERRKKQ